MIYDLLVRSAIELIETGFVPDWLTRRAIRRLCQRRLHSLEMRGEAETLLNQFVSEARRGPIAPVPEKANQQHYEVPAEFYDLVLGHRRKYSCCFWEENTATLDEAEDASLSQTCTNAELQDGMHVLELGCGWGALSLWIAEKFPNCRITAVSNSHSQRRYIEQQAERRGFADRLDVVTADMNDFESFKKFDRILSLEMFEHMRNYERLLSRISGWLSPGGKLLVHVFCHARFAYEFADGGADDWMSRYFFTGGIMPSDDLLCRFPRHLRVSRQWRWSGDHYRRTAEAWVANLDRNRNRLLPILANIYGGQPQRWWRRWRLLFLSGAELFGYGSGWEWYVSHYLLEPIPSGVQADAEVAHAAADSKGETILSG